ncbi:hypothetical protein ACOSQ3_015972 [Xanthoceras sorbifolium]
MEGLIVILGKYTFREGGEVAKKKPFVPSPCFMNVDEARELHIRVERKRDSATTDYFDNIGGHCMKGDAVIVVKGDLINLRGRVEKVDEENVHIRPEMKGLPKTLALNQKELTKYFEHGNHVKVISGTQQGATGMVIHTEHHVLTILSDTTKEHIDVFADDVVLSSEVNSTTSIEGYELRDLVLLDDLFFHPRVR